MEKLSRMPVSRAAMNKLVMNYLVTEGFKVRPRSWAAMNQLVMNCHVMIYHVMEGLMVSTSV